MFGGAGWWICSPADSRPAGAALAAGYDGHVLKSNPKRAPVNAQKPATFTERLRDLREKSGLHSYDIADKMGVRLSVYLALEVGKREPTFADACKLADALGVSLDELRGARPSRR